MADSTDQGDDADRAGDFERYALVAMMTLVVLCLLFVDGLRERQDSATLATEDRLLHVEIGRAAPAVVMPRQEGAADEAHAESDTGHALPIELRPAPPAEAVEGARPAGTPADSAIPPASRTYVVGDGDTLTAIATRELGSPKRALEIARLNALDDPDVLHAGQQLVLPGE